MNSLARLASAHAHWTLVAATRALIGVLVAYGVARNRGTEISLRGASLQMWLRTLFGTAAMCCTFVALSARALPLGDAVTLFAMTPVLLALIGPHVLGEPTGGRVWLALGISLAGVLCIVRPTLLWHPSHAEAEMIAPAGIAFGAACFSSGAMVMLRKLSRAERGARTSPEQIVIHFSLTAFVLIALLAIPHFRLPSRHDALRMLLAGTCGGLAQLAMTRAYALERAARIGAFGNLTYALSAMAGIFVLGERTSALALLGMGLVLGASLLVSLGGPRVDHTPEPGSIPPPPVREFEH